MSETMSLPTDNLSISQLRYISQRAWHETDAEAAAAAGVTARTVARWRNESPGFVEAEKSIWTGDIQRTREIMGRARDKAALVLENLLVSGDPRTQRAAAVDLLDRGGMARGETLTVQVSGALAGLLAEAEKPPTGETGG